VAGEDLGPPRAQRAAKGADLLDDVAKAAGDGLVDQQLGVGAVAGEVDVAHRFLSVIRP